MPDIASPRWADQLSYPYRGNSAWTQETEHFLSNPWACYAMGITEPDTALLTHETNTCRLFKKYFNKTAWLAPGCPYPLSPCALLPPTPHSTMVGSWGGQNLF